MKTVLLAAALVASAASAPPASPETPSPAARDAQRLGPMAAELRNRVGKWQVAAELRFTPTARPVTIDAVAESRLVGGRWLVTELRSRDPKEGFHGIGVNGYDPARRKYVGYWIDGTRGQLIPVEGVYDPGQRLFRTTSLERTARGGTITVVSETRTLGPDEEVTAFTAPDAEGHPFVRMRLSYRREAPAAR